jgi:hypothetical protein
MIAATLVQRWPDLLLITETLAPPIMTEIPVGKSTKLGQLPL